MVMPFGLKSNPLCGASAQLLHNWIMVVRAKPLINRLIVRCTRKTMPECTVQETPRQRRLQRCAGVGLGIPACPH